MAAAAHLRAAEAEVFTFVTILVPDD